MDFDLSASLSKDGGRAIQWEDLPELGARSPVMIALQPFYQGSWRDGSWLRLVKLRRPCRDGQTARQTALAGFGD